MTVGELINALSGYAGEQIVVTREDPGMARTPVTFRHINQVSSGVLEHDEAVLLWIGEDVADD